MRATRVRAGALALVCAAVAACSTTVNGRGTIAADARLPSRSGTPDGTTSRSGTSSGQPTPESVHCEGSKVIAPAGAPYCFAVPDGFVDVSSSVTVDASIGNERFRSTVAVNQRGRDLIIVTTYELRLNSDRISDETLAAELARVLGQLTKQGFTFDSTTPKRTTVDGARAFGYHARERRNRLEADVYFVFRGRNELEINCQWKDLPADVTRGCEAVLNTLQFKTVS